MKYQTLQIFRPTISQNLTQGWAENRACLRGDGSIYGIQKGKTCPGASFYQSIGMKGHNGYDIGGMAGEDIYHAATYAGWWHTEIDSAGGIGVDVISNEPLFFPMPIPTELVKTAVPHIQDGIPGFTHYVKMRYWHLSKAVGSNKKQVTPGTIIGLMGNTGASSATHLHFSPKWCLQDGRGVGNNNGFNGAFDPTPYYQHRTTVVDHMRYTNQEVLPLTPVETKDILSQLNALQVILLGLRKTLHLL